MSSLSDYQNMISAVDSELKQLKAKKAQLREALQNILDTAKDTAKANESRKTEEYTYICPEYIIKVATDALAGPERELHISPELIMNRDETKKSSFIGPSGAELAWNEMKNDDALAGPEVKR